MATTRSQDISNETDMTTTVINNANKNITIDDLEDYDLKDVQETFMNLTKSGEQVLFLLLKQVIFCALEP